MPHGHMAIRRAFLSLPVKSTKVNMELKEAKPTSSTLPGSGHLRLFLQEGTLNKIAQLQERICSLVKLTGMVLYGYATTRSESGERHANSESGGRFPTLWMTKSVHTILKPGKTIVCCYLQGNRIIPEFLKRCRISSSTVRHAHSHQSREDQTICGTNMCSRQ